MLVNEAITAGIAVDAVFLDDAWSIESGWWPTGDIDPVIVTGGVLASVLSTSTPQPVCAVARLLDRSVADVIAGCVAAARPLLVLVEVADPGNVGTLLRAAEASGCGGVVLTTGSADLYNPKTVRASAGSIFRLPVTRDVGTSELLTVVGRGGLRTWAAVARDGVPHLDARLDGAVAIMVGNEAHGLSPELVASCDEAVTITMDGPSESLNAAMAGTVLVFEALRQRHVSGPVGRVGHNGGHELP